MEEREILKEISTILKVDERMIPVTLKRFKKEIEEMKKELSC